MKPEYVIPAHHTASVSYKQDVLRHCIVMLIFLTYWLLILEGTLRNNRYNEPMLAAVIGRAMRVFGVRW